VEKKTPIGTAHTVINRWGYHWENGIRWALCSPHWFTSANPMPIQKAQSV